MAGGRGGTAVERGGKDCPDSEHALVGPHAPGARQVRDDVDAAAAQRGPRGVRRTGPGGASPVTDRDLDRFSVHAPGDAQPRAGQRPGMAYRVAEQLADHEDRVTYGRLEDSDGKQLPGQAAPRDRDARGAAGRSTTLDVLTSLRIPAWLAPMPAAPR